jgi:NADPH:quinone reductase-like Zn-dependent oxidoreductase
MAALPATMRAVLYDSAPPHHMRMKADVPVPKPSASQVLVRVAAAAINPVDYKLGSMPVVGWFLRGKGVGLDFSGTVEAAGSAAAGKGFAPGDRVFGNCSGTLAEFAVAEAADIAKVPASMTHKDAASLPLAGLTSLQSLERGGVKHGDRVLIPGASGGTGALGVQIAKCLGARHVTGICSAANAQLARDLGCDAVADYAQSPEALRAAVAEHGPYDVCYDTVSSPEDQNYGPLAREVLKPGGMLVAINGSGGEWTRALLSKATGLNLQRANYDLLLKKNDGAGVARMAAWVEAKKLKPLIDSTHPFTAEGVDAAFARLKSRRAKGKVVVAVASE